MAYHDSTATSFGASNAIVGTMPATNLGDDVYAVISQDNPAASYAGGIPAGWAQLTQITQSAPDNQTLTIFQLTGGAPASPPASFTWVSTITNDDTQIFMMSFSGRTLARTFITPTNSTVGNTSPISAAMAGGTTVTGDDLVMVLALDKTNSATDTWSFGTPTGGPGTPSWVLRQNKGTDALFVGMGLATANAVAGGATGTITDVITQLSGTNPSGWLGWIFALPTSSSGVVSRNAGGGSLIGSRTTGRRIAA